MSDFKPNEFLFLLSKIKGLGPHTIYKLIRDYNGLDNLQLAIAGDFGQRHRIGRLIKDWLTDQNWLEEKIQEFTAIPEPCLNILDSDYPVYLKQIYDPPLLIYYRGNKNLLSSRYLLTIVGSRRLTNYHKNALEQIIMGLAHTPLIITSGLALGIDGLAHELALKYKLPTIAVLGSSLDDKNLYPQDNLKLAHQILEDNGLLISEYPANTPLEPYNFPKRNRILAGLSKATVIISGAHKSGTLITAQCALDEGREVLALPGNINQTLCRGPNALLENSASILLSAQDILKIYNLNRPQKDANKLPILEPLEKQIYDYLLIEPLAAAELAKKLKLPLSAINSHISSLELKGLINLNQFNQAEIK